MTTLSSYSSSPFTMDIVKVPEPYHGNDRSNNRPGSISAKSITKVNGNGVGNQTRVKVLILAYHRSGSTLTGELFQKNPAAFYWFEPLIPVTYPWRWLSNGVRGRNYFHNDDGSLKPIPAWKRNALLNPLRSCFNCEMDKLGSQLKHWLASCSSSTQPYVKCVKHNKRQTCANQLANSCRRKSIVAIKVIRMEMHLVEDLLRTDPAIRILHLTRDPRGMLQSWWKPRRKNADGIRSKKNARIDAFVMCRRILDECTLREQLEVKYPGRLLHVRYEDLATDPDRVVRDVYEKLLQRPAPSVVVTAIKRLEHGSREKSTGTERKNSNATAYSWRHMKPWLLSSVTSTCAKLLKHLRYAR